MSDETQEKNVTPEQETPESSSSDGTQNTGNTTQSIPYLRFKEVNDERKALQARLEALEEADRKRKEAELAEEGRYQELIETLKPEAERAKQLEAQLAEYQQRDEAELEAELDALDESVRGLVIGNSATERLTWLRNAQRAGLFTKPSAPTTDAGAGGDPKPPEKELPPAQQRLYNLAKARRYIKGGKS